MSSKWWKYGTSELMAVMPPSRTVIEAQSHLSLASKGIVKLDAEKAKLAQRYDWYISNVQFFYREFGVGWREVEVSTKTSFVNHLHFECTNFEFWLEQDNEEYDVQFGVV